MIKLSSSSDSELDLTTRTSIYINIYNAPHKFIQKNHKTSLYPFMWALLNLNINVVKSSIVLQSHTRVVKQIPSYNKEFQTARDIKVKTARSFTPERPAINGANSPLARLIRLQCSHYCSVAPRSSRCTAVKSAVFTIHVTELESQPWVHPLAATASLWEEFPYFVLIQYNNFYNKTEAYSNETINKMSGPFKIRPNLVWNA